MMEYMMIDIMITIVFVIAFYKLNVNLDRDIFEQYREVERELRWLLWVTTALIVWIIET